MRIPVAAPVPRFLGLRKAEGRPKALQEVGDATGIEPVTPRCQRMGAEFPAIPVNEGSAVKSSKADQDLNRILHPMRRSRSTAVQDATAKCLGKGSCFLFAVEIDPTDICARNLPEAHDLKFHVIEPDSHLAQLLRQGLRVDSDFDNVRH
jgi:hypothetical protein